MAFPHTCRLLTQQEQGEDCCPATSQPTCRSSSEQGRQGCHASRGVPCSGVLYQEEGVDAAALYNRHSRCHSGDSTGDPAATAGGASIQDPAEPLMYDNSDDCLRDCLQDLSSSAASVPLAAGASLPTTNSNNTQQHRQQQQQQQGSHLFQRPRILNPRGIAPAAAYRRIWTRSWMDEEPSSPVHTPARPVCTLFSE